MLVKHLTVINSVLALRRLDGSKFDSIALLHIARNLRRLTECAGDIERVRVGLQQKYGVTDKDADSGKPIWTAYASEWQQFIEKETEIHIHLMTVKDLNLTANQIPVTALAALDWMIEPESDERKG